MSNLQIIVRSFLQNQVSGNDGYFSFFWKSIIVYSFGYLMKVLEVPNAISEVIMGIGLVFFGFTLYKLIKFRIKNTYLKYVFIAYLLWEVFIILHDFQNLNYSLLKVLLFQPYTFLPYFIPLLIFIPYNLFYTKILYNTLEKLLYVLFFVFIVFIQQVLITNQDFSEQIVWTLGTGAGFILLTWNFHSKRTRTIAIIAALLCLFIATVMARRNIMLTFSNFLFFSFILYITNSKRTINQKLGFLFLSAIIVTSGYVLFFKYQDELFSKITNRIDIDSREEVFAAYFYDLSTNNLIIGKGMNGTYFCPGIDEDYDYRPLIENGYLQLILKGGIIYLILFLAIAIPAMVLGIRSKNSLGKAAGVIVLLWLIDMIAWGVPAMNIRYIILWISIGICYSKEIRGLSEKEFKNALILLS